MIQQSDKEAWHFEVFIFWQETKCKLLKNSSMKKFKRLKLAIFYPRLCHGVFGLEIRLNHYPWSHAAYLWMLRANPEYCSSVKHPVTPSILLSLGFESKHEDMQKRKKTAWSCHSYSDSASTLSFFLCILSEWCSHSQGHVCSEIFLLKYIYSNAYTFCPGKQWKSDTCDFKCFSYFDLSQPDI